MLTSPAIRLLISHNQMGTIIGRQGLKIKQIQDASGVRMVAQKEMLPQSTERIVEVQGTAEHQLFDRKSLDAMLDAGRAAIRQLTEAQQKVLGG